MAKRTFEEVLYEIKTGATWVEIEKNYLITNFGKGNGGGVCGGHLKTELNDEIRNIALDEINKSDNIKILWINNTKIDYLNMRNKEMLEFNNCDLSNLEFNGNFVQMRVLCFRNCTGFIKSFSIFNNIGQLHFIKIDLSNINVDEIENIKIRELTIRECNLNRVPKFIKKLQYLDWLVLIHNNIYKLPKSAKTWKFQLSINNNPIHDMLNGKAATINNLIDVSDMVRFNEFLIRYFAIAHNMPSNVIRTITLFIKK